MRILVCVLVFGFGSAVAQSPAEYTFARAGHPESVAPWARSARSPKKTPEYLGRAIVRDAEGTPAFSEGVIGYDLRKPSVDANQRPGTYRTDGPRVFDIFSIRPLRRALAER